MQITKTTNEDDLEQPKWIVTDIEDGEHSEEQLADELEADGYSEADIELPGEIGCSCYCTDCLPFTSQVVREGAEIEPSKGRVGCFNC